jgi:hypothetical protein
MRIEGPFSYAPLMLLFLVATEDVWISRSWVGWKGAAGFADCLGVVVDCQAQDP